MRVVFRADGNSVIGLGHLVRLLAIAEILPVKYEKVFLVRTPEDSSRAMLEASGVNVIALQSFHSYPEEAEYITDNILSKEDIIVLDGYHFTAHYQRIIGSLDNQVVLISDYPQDGVVADVVINHAEGITSTEYTSYTYTRFYLGAAYALLRPPFLKKRTHAIAIREKIESVMICFGGADPENLSLKLMRDLRKAGYHGDLHIIIGSAYPYYEELTKQIDDQTKVSRNLSADQMADSIANTDLVICPSSSISYEICSIGRPLLTGLSANNQQNIYAFISENKLGYGIGHFSHINPAGMKEAISYLTDQEVRSKQLSHQKRWFDQNSKNRLQKTFEKIEWVYKTHLQKAQRGHLEILFKWVNDPEVRSTAIDTSPISLDTHTRWFDHLLISDNNYLYILYLSQEPIGQIRFDKQNKEYLLSYSIAKSYRGMGLGEVLVRKGIKALMKEIGKSPVIQAFVRENNVVSSKVFEKNHFILKEKKEIKGGNFHIYFRK